MSIRAVEGPKATIIDYGVVESGIKERETDQVSRSLAFTKLVVETVFQIPSEEVDEYIVDGGGDRGIDIIYIDHDNRRINIGSCKTVSNYRNSQKFFPAEECDKVISFVDDLLYARLQNFSACNPRLIAKVSEVMNVFENESYEVAVHLFSNQLTLPKDARERLTQSLDRHNAPLFEYGLFELAHGVVKATRPTFKKKLLPHSASSVSMQEGGTTAIVTRVELKDLAKFLDADSRFDERLVWQNVRYFLGLENEVNREIRSTLQGPDSELFWLLNSGLTIVCDKIASLANGHHPLTLVNPQIVNGCQTAAVIHAVSQNTINGLNKGSVQVRIIQTSNPELIEKIALASNTQSRILSRDLRTNDPLQQKLAAALKPYGYFYRRKRGEQNLESRLEIIDSARAGQLLLAYVCGEPVKSKTSSNNIFGDLYPEAFNSAVVTPEILISAYECHKIIQARRAQALAWQQSLSAGKYEETWLIEGHFHVLFVVGELIKRSRRDLANVATATELIAKAIEIIQEFVERNPRVSFYRLFRLEQSREQILALLDEDESEQATYPVQLRLEFGRTS